MNINRVQGGSTSTQKFCNSPATYMLGIVGATESLNTVIIIKNKKQMQCKPDIEEYKLKCEKYANEQMTQIMITGIAALIAK